MYRFALRPRWLLGHLVVLALVFLLVALGLWQLRRLDERRRHNAVVADRSARVVPLPPEGWRRPTEPAGLAFRRVLVRGRYDAAGEVLVRFRSNQGLPGYHVLTPMATAGGTILVNRGWVPLAMGARWPVAEARPPAGDISVTGLLRPSEPAGGFLPERSGPDGPLSVGAVDIAGLERQLSVPLYPLHLQLDAEAQGKATFPAALPAPDLEDGPHLSYAVQWFVFAAGAAAGWLVLVRSSARRRDSADVAGGPRPTSAAAGLPHAGGESPAPPPGASLPT